MSLMSSWSNKCYSSVEKDVIIMIFKKKEDSNNGVSQWRDNKDLAQN